MEAHPIPHVPPTCLLFRDDAYCQRAQARVIAVVEGRLVLDQTLFYPASGGQPADEGTLTKLESGQAIGQPVPVSGLGYLDSAKTIVAHALPETEAPADWLGALVQLDLDFARRHAVMRMHSALHLLSVALPYPVTGGAIGTQEGRLDFDIPDAGLDKDEITQKLNALRLRNAEITDRWITDAQLDANPGLVKTMSVAPPRGTGRVRLVAIEGLDLQPCGGTHVRNTAEIGALAVTNIEKKGKQNRRVRIAFV